MNIDETKLYSWFLGPKAENADLLERLILEALRDCVFRRRIFHPEDDIIIFEPVHWWILLMKSFCPAE